ncbi:MAG: hypothetical protein HOV94_08625 [Saccharothrix sp.]|nr:hypothetical protein [Saccharothrix sp.]
MAQETRPDPLLSGWASGGLAFAAVMLFMIGLFQIVAGLVALIDDRFYVVDDDYAFVFDVTAWGWIHLLLGLGLIAVGWGLSTRATWSGVTAIALAVVSSVANFFFIPYYPFWSLLIIALNAWVIWSLTRPHAIRT